jgi:hypothetical protein
MAVLVRFKRVQTACTSSYDCRGAQAGRRVHIPVLLFEKAWPSLRRRSAHSLRKQI